MENLQKYLRNRKYKGGRRNPYIDRELVSVFPKRGRFIYKDNIYTYKSVQFMQSKKGGYPVAHHLEKLKLSMDSAEHLKPTQQELEEIQKAMASGFLLNLNGE